MLELMSFQEKMYAIIIRSTYKNKPVDFFTDDQNPLQMGMFTRNKGYTVKPHKHVCDPFTIEQVQEFIYVKQGQLLMSFFSEKGKKYAECILNKGDLVLTILGGHGIHFLKKSTLLEIKQGPYKENKKVFYEDLLA